MDVTRSVTVTEPSQVAEARRAASTCARERAFPDVDEGRVALVATELATNLVKHGGGGSLLVQSSGDRVELIAIDKGRGMVDVARCLEDGYSTAGSPGTGLGSVRRTTRDLRIYSAVDRGTVVVATVEPAEREAHAFLPLDVASLEVPYPGETICGDIVRVAASPQKLGAIVADGLGHGLGAAKASSTAAELFLERAPAESPRQQIERLHLGLRPTRGAAVLVVSIDLVASQLTYCGVGNITGAAFHLDGTKRFVSHNGTLGHEFRHAQEFSLAWTEDTVLVLHSDGLSAHFKPEDYPGLLSQPAAVIASVIYRDFRRQRDDASVLVVKRDRGDSGR